MHDDVTSFELTAIREATNAHTSNRLHLATLQKKRSFGETASTPYRNNSSRTNGMATAIANGHPTIAPVANARVVNRVRRMFLLLAGSSAKAKATALAYMAKEDGKNAVASGISGVLGRMR